MFKKMLTLVLVTVMVSAYFATVAPQRTSAASTTYYVDAVNGNDANDGSSGHPWATIGKAANVMTAGDTAKIRSGVYRETVKPASDGVTFEADDGADVTVSGADLVAGTWTAAPDVAANVFSTDAAMGMGDYLNQVYVDGTANNLARSPNTELGNLYDPNLYTYDSTKSNRGKLVDNVNLNQPAGTWDGAALFVEDSASWNFSSAIVTSSAPGYLNILNSQAYLQVRLSSYDNKLTLVNQNGTVLGSSNVAVQLNTVYNVKVEAADSAINVYLNNGATPVITASDPNPIEGFFELGLQSSSSAVAATGEFTNVNADITAQSLDQVLGQEPAMFASNLRGWSYHESNGYWTTDGTKLTGYTQPQTNSTTATYSSAAKAKNFTYSADIKLTSAGVAAMNFRKQDVPYLNDLADWGLQGSEYYIAGKLSQLDYPGEWYYDKTARKLYLMTEAKDNPSNHTIEVKARNLAFDLADRSNVTIKGIKLFASTIDMANGANNVIDGIHAKYVSEYYVLPSGYSGGICLCGTNNTLKNSDIGFSTASLVRIDGTGNKLFNNIIHDGTYGPEINTPLVEMTGVGHLVSNNTLYDAGQSLLGGSYYAADIQYNDFSKHSFFSRDDGMLYEAHIDLGYTEIHNNYFHDNGHRSKGIDGDGSFGAGLYIDESMSNVLAYDNVTWGIPWRGIMVNHLSDFVQVFNNTTYDDSIIELMNPGYTIDLYKDKAYNNISVDGFDTSGVTLGADYKGNLTEGDPLYVDAAGRDFRLQAGSPARDAGVPIAGITDPADSAPDIGAYQNGETPWKAGADLANPPAADPTFHLTHTEYRDLLVNGSLDLHQMNYKDWDSLHGWTTTYSKTAQPAYDYSGNYVTSRYRWETGIALGKGEDGIEQTITGLEPNTKYEARGFLRSTEAGKGVEIGAKDFGGSDISSGTAETTWQTKTFTFTTGPDSTSATIYAYKGDTGSYAFVDDISVVKWEEPPAQPPAAPHGDPGTLAINDTVTGTGSGEFNYTGSWATQTGNPFNYHSDNHNSSTAGDAYEVKFDGVQIELHSELDADMGVVGVSVDNGEEQLIDTYSQKHTGDAMIYASPRLPDGAHTLKVRVTGTKNAASSGTRHAADRVVVVSAAAPVHVNDSVTGTDVNQFDYSGTWAEAAGEGDYQSGSHQSATKDSAYQMTFDGVQFKLFGETDTGMGIAGVSIDGGPEFQADMYSASRAEGALVFTSPRLPDGRHTVKVRVTGDRNTLATGSAIAADRVDIISANTPITIDDSATGTGNNQFNYHGTWWPGTGNAVAYMNDVHFTNEAGAYYEMPFVGKGIQLYVEINNAGSLVDVYIDGTKMTTLDYYSEVHMGDYLVYSSPALTDGPHTLKVVNEAVAGPNGGNIWSGSDRIDILPTSIPDTSAPNAPAGLTSPSVTASTAELSWQAAGDNYGVEYYEVYDGDALIGVSQGTSYTVTGLEEGKTYAFSVKAKDAAGNASAASAAIEVLPHAPLPNLALGKPATETSVYAPGYEGINAFDGDPATRWAAGEGSANPQSVVVNLGESAKIDHIKLNWADPYATAYQILVSSDGADWHEVYGTTSGDGGLDDVRFAAVDAQYVKITASARSDGYWGVSLYEAEIYPFFGETPPPPAETNLALGKTVAVSSTYADEWQTFPAANAVDGDGTTKWAAAAGEAADAAQSISVDLGAIDQVDGMKLNWDVPNATSYKVEVSTDGTEWTEVYATDSGDGGIDEMAFPAAAARYVKLTSTARNDGYYGIALKEMEVYGEQGATPPPTSANLALGKDVTVSSTYADQWGSTFPAGNAVDGDAGTRWAAAAFTADPQWVAVDLGKTTRIDHVKLTWESLPAAITYKLQVSTDGTNWTDVYASSPGAGDANDIAFDAADARYVRMYASPGDPGDYGISLKEFEIYGAGDTPPPPPANANLALGKDVTVSSSYADQWGSAYPAGNAVDGDAGTRWAAAAFTADPQWVAIDLGETTRIDHVKLTFNGLPAGVAYKVQVSTDGSSWSDVYSSAPDDGAADDITFAATDARYVRMYATPASSGDYGISLYEFEIYGADGTAPANQAPTATGVTITGTAEAGQPLTGHYAYNDADGDPEGASALQWFRGAQADGSDRAAIASASGGTYAVTADDAGSYVFFQVTPAAASGVVQGDSVLSAGIYIPVSDAGAPVTTATSSIQPNDAGWNKSNVAIALSAVDNGGGSGVKELTYSATGAQSIAETKADGATANVTIAEEGVTTLSFYATDAAGNKEAVQTLAVRVDKTAPVVSFSGAGTYTVDQTVQITCSAADPVSGLAATPCEAPLVNAPAYALGLGSHALSAEATDLAGNTAQATGNYEVKVTLESLLNLLKQWITGPGANGIVNSLAAKAQQNKPDAFINEVSAQTGKRITPQQAEMLKDWIKMLKK